MEGGEGVRVCEEELKRKEENRMMVFATQVQKAQKGDGLVLKIDAKCLVCWCNVYTHKGTVMLRFYCQNWDSAVDQDSARK